MPRKSKKRIAQEIEDKKNKELAEAVFNSYNEPTRNKLLEILGQYNPAIRTALLTGKINWETWDKIHDKRRDDGLAFPQLDYYLEGNTRSDSKKDAESNVNDLWSIRSKMLDLETNTSLVYVVEMWMLPRRHSSSPYATLAPKIEALYLRELFKTIDPDHFFYRRERLAGYCKDLYPVSKIEERISVWQQDVVDRWDEIVEDKKNSWKNFYMNFYNYWSSVGRSDAAEETKSRANKRFPGFIP